MSKTKVTKSKKTYLSILAALVIGGGVAAAILLPITQCSKKPSPNTNNDLSFEIYNADNSNHHSPILEHNQELTVTITQEKDFGPIIWAYSPQDPEDVIFEEDGSSNQILTIKNKNVTESHIVLDDIVAYDQKGNHIEISNITCKHYTTINVKAIDGSDWEGYYSGSLYYFIDEDSKEITYVGNDEYVAEDLVIPDEVYGEDGETIYKVTSIANACFSYTELFGDLTIGNNVEFVGNSAFSFCTNLDGTLTIPSSLKDVGEYPFHLCSFDDIELSELNASFAYANNVGDAKIVIRSLGSKDVGLNYGVPLITPGQGFIFACGDLTVPENVTSIGQQCFSSCTSLTSITLTKVEELGDMSFVGCGEMIGNITIPSTLTTIGADVFNGTYFDGITIENPASNHFSLATSASVGEAKILMHGSTPIPYDYNGESSQIAGNLGIGGVTIPEEITTIGDSCFNGCNWMTSLTLPTNLETIGSRAFAECGEIDDTLSISDSVSSIGADAFKSTRFTDVEIGSSNNAYSLATSASVGEAKILMSGSTPQAYNYSGDNSQIVGSLAVVAQQLVIVEH